MHNYIAVREKSPADFPGLDRENMTSTFTAVICDENFFPRLKVTNTILLGDSKETIFLVFGRCVNEYVPTVCFICIMNPLKTGDIYRDKTTWEQ